jgi:protein ImuB
VDRTACTDLPAFPLQLLLRRHPDWRHHPAAVVENDRPGGRILWVNERARAARILPGMRYAAGLSLAGSLRAAEVPAREIRRTVATIARLLRRHTPGVEPAADDPGVFWLDASGLERLHESLADWGAGVRSALGRLGFESTLVVGFLPFGAYALARAGQGLRVLADPEEETAALRRVPLERLAIEPEVRDTLRKLGVRTLGRFLDLPGEGIARRFGAAAHRLHRLASGELALPLQRRQPPEPAVKRLLLDHAETDVGRLLVGIDRLLGAVLEMLASRGQALTRLHLRLVFESRPRRDETLRPAEPTLDAAQLRELLRLRLESARFLDGVVEVVLGAGSAPASRQQLQLFARRPRRNPAAAERALARLRAELGDDAVVRARLQDGHLPEARFRWEQATKVAEARPRGAGEAALVRRIYGRPRPLPPRQRHEPDGWMLRGLERGPVVRMEGPYVVSGGWWNRTAVHREYHFAETQKGEVLWVYYDRERRRWFLQGRVE